MIRQIGWALVAMSLLVLPTVAKGVREPDLAPFAADWQACETQIGASEDHWVGWHRDFGNGYADNFEFHDGRFDEVASALAVTHYIDGIAREDTTWCYRGDGSLSMIAVTMQSPDIAAGGEMGPSIRREGRLYFDAEGHRLAVRAWLTDADGGKIGAIDSQEHQLARDCNPVDLRLSADDAGNEYLSVLGDIEGNHPAYTANELDWCAEAEEGP